MSFDFSLPVNTALGVLIIYYVQSIIFPSVKVPEKVPTEYNDSYTWLPANHPPTVLYKIFTPKTLEPFSGKDGGRILLSIKGTVFDVTAGRSFYGPGHNVAQCALRSSP